MQKEVDGLMFAARIASARHTPTERQKCAEVFIYFIQEMNTRAIKIGSTLSIAKRLKTLQTANIGELRLIGALRDPIGGGLERTVRARFKALRVRGEWFREAPELLAYIDRYAGAETGAAKRRGRPAKGPAVTQKKPRAA